MRSRSLGERGAVWLEFGDLRAAGAVLTRALSLVRGEDVHHEYVFLVRLAQVHARAGARHAAKRTLAEAERVLGARPARHRALLRVGHAQLALAEAEAARAVGNESVATELIAFVRAEVEAMPIDDDSAWWPFDPTGMRLCCRLIQARSFLERTLFVLEQPGRTSAAPAAAPVKTADRLTVAAAYVAFRVEGHDRVPLERRPSLRRVFARLVERRAAGEREPTSVAELFAAGWPGERISESSMRQRVRTAIWTLRRIGLGPLLQQRVGGYEIAPHCEIAAGD